MCRHKDKAVSSRHRQRDTRDLFKPTEDEDSLGRGYLKLREHRRTCETTFYVGQNDLMMA